MKALDKDGLDYVVDKIYDVVNSGGSADYIVEEGTSGIWTYRKWASGIAECWGTASHSGTWSQWGSLYALPFDAVLFPFTFYSLTKVYYTPNIRDTGSNSCWAGVYNGMSNEEKLRGCKPALVRPTAGDTSTYYCHIYATGLWKEFTPSVSHQWATMQTGNGTKTSAVASFERCYWQKFGNLVFVAFTFTTASSGITTTSQFFTGLPKPIAYFRFSGTLGNTSKSCRLSLDLNGVISNAYTVVGDIQGGVVDGSVVYYTSE